MFYTKEPPVWKYYYRNTRESKKKKKEKSRREKEIYTLFHFVGFVRWEIEQQTGSQKPSRIVYAYVAASAAQPSEWRERIFKHTRKERKRQTVSQINWQFQT